MQSKDIQALQTIIGDPERVSTRKADLEAHSIDESFHEGHEPEVVIWPQSATEISAILKFANQHRIPVTPRSGGSSLEVMKQIKRLLDPNSILNPGKIFEAL
jgi:D-lactate dehydrogenase (cytochrome)